MVTIVLDFRFSATSILLLISVSGLFMNLLVVGSMWREHEGFRRICLNKAIANIMIVSAYIIWAVPCSYMNAYYLPHQFNVFFGQIIGWGPYLMSGPFTQICLALNRATAISYPLWFDKSHRLPFTNATLLALWTLAILVSLPSMIDGCSYLFYPDTISWGTMDTRCSLMLTKLFTSAVITLAVISFTINVFSAAKLLKLSMKSGRTVNEGVSAARKKRRMKMFVQCIVQDCTHSLDCFVNNYLYFMYVGNWFQFLCGAVSGLVVIVLDGLVMTLLHQKPPLSRRTSRVSTAVINI